MDKSEFVAAFETNETIWMHSQIMGSLIWWSFLFYSFLTATKIFEAIWMCSQIMGSLIWFINRFSNEWFLIILFLWKPRYEEKDEDCVHEPDGDVTANWNCDVHCLLKDMQCSKQPKPNNSACS